MSKIRSITAQKLLAGLQAGAVTTIAVAAFGLTIVSIAGAVGLAPSLVVPVQIGETAYPGAGLAIQFAIAAILLAVAATLPGAARTLRLERSHRDFRICMSDVAEAYRACHAADRQGTFTLSREYDAVRERMTYLRQHPDLGHLEPDVLETAAEMSYASRELAETYSEANVSRARAFLAARRDEVSLFEERLAQAVAACRELSRERDAVDDAIGRSEARLGAMEAEFGDLLADLGFARTGSRVLPMPTRPGVAAE